jgi:hypothetical protein
MCNVFVSSYETTKRKTVTSGLSENLIYPTLHWESPSLVCVQSNLMNPTPGLSNTLFIQHLVYPTPCLSNTLFIQHLVYPAPCLSNTFYDEQMWSDKQGPTLVYITQSFMYVRISG